MTVSVKEMGILFATANVPSPNRCGSDVDVVHSRLYIEGVLAFFTHLKCQKCIGDDVGDLKYIFLPKQKILFYFFL
jgi:hypothetical protein